MRFQPVHLPPDRQLNGKASQTFLRHYAGCPRSGYLYAAFKGEARTADMERGRALHAIIERAVRACMEHNEGLIPPEIVKAIADEVLAEYAVPVEQHDQIREMSYRWAAQTALNPHGIIACETLFVLDIGGYQVRCKVDYAETIEKDAAILVRDWKSSRAAPAYEEIARKRSDGSLAAKQFQLILYALVLAYGVPVRVEACDLCGGTGRFAIVPEDDCARCDGRGEVERPEPFPVASTAQRFDLELVFPAIEDREGNMLRRGTSLTRLELDEYRASFDGLLKRVAHSEETGDWPAVVSDAACGECPAPSCCPIPSELRDHRGEINTVEQAAEAAEILDRIAAEQAAIRKEIKAFCKAHEIDLRFGNKVFEFVPKSSERISDRDAMFDAMERAVRYGEPFDRRDYVKTVNGTDFRARDLTPDELAEPEGSNDERSADERLDERYGAEAPY